MIFHSTFFHNVNYNTMQWIDCLLSTIVNLLWSMCSSANYFEFHWFFGGFCFLFLLLEILKSNECDWRLAILLKTDYITNKFLNHDHWLAFTVLHSFAAFVFAVVWIVAFVWRLMSEKWNLLFFFDNELFERYKRLIKAFICFYWNKW